MLQFRKKPWKMRRVAVLLLLVVALTACGAKTSGVEQEKEPQQTKEVEQSKEAEQTKEPIPAEEAATKKLDTLYGVIEVPVKPKRIIADEYLGTLLAIGAKPIATNNIQLKNPYVADRLTEVEDIGDYGNASLEKIVDLQPDLIISGTHDKDKYEVYSKAGTTLVIPYGQLTNAHEELTYFGELLGLQEEAAAWLKEYDTRIAAAKAKVDAAIPADATFTIFEASDKAVWMYGDNFGRGGQPIYQALGRQPRAEVAAEIMEKQWMELSYEVIGDYAGDYIILTVESEETINLEKLRQDPIWNTLDAVKNGRVYIWPESRSWYYDPAAVLLQTEELANWLVGE